MTDYQQAYAQATGHPASANAAQLTPLFAAIASGQKLPPRAQQAVALGLTAHTLNDPQADPPLFAYYHWVLRHYFAGAPLNELSARLIGMAFTSANLFKTELPQPLTLNPWQAAAMQDHPLVNQRAVVIENNGVFVLLLQRHPDWPLIAQGGNDFNPTYVSLIQRLEQRGVQFAYSGDLDSRGIQMADHFYQLLQQTPIEVVAALQQPVDVASWLALYGKKDPQRTRQLQVTTPLYQTEMDSLQVFGKFVEQEQLLAEYERLIPQWLATK